MKVVPVEVEFFYTDRQRERHEEANSHSSQFSECA